MLPSVSAPCPDGKREICLTYAQRVELWRRLPNSDLAERPSALISHMGAVALEVSMAAERAVIMDHDEAKSIPELFRDNFAPKVADSVYP